MNVKAAATNLTRHFARRLSARLDPPGKNQGTGAGNPRLQRLAKKSREHEARITRLEGGSASPTPSNKKGRVGKRPGRLREDKLRLIDLAFGRFGARSFADLGGVGKIDGGYTFYTLDEYSPERGVLADVRAAYLRDKAGRYPALELVEGNFGDGSVAERVGNVDALYLFAVLVHQGHQGAAGWDDILELYAERTRLFLVHNPQWTGSEESVRLSGFGKEEYREKVPGTKGTSLQEMRPIPPELGGESLILPWEMGVTDGDLMEKMKALGFKLEYFENTGTFREGFENFENHGFIFSR